MHAFRADCALAESMMPIPNAMIRSRSRRRCPYNRAMTKRAEMPEWDWLEKASDEELRKLAADRFHQYRTNFHESAVEFLYEGQFIVQLLESRRTGKIEARSRKLEHTSLFLEVVIVALIVVEIGLAVVSLRDHSTEEAILHLESTIRQSAPAAR